MDPGTVWIRPKPYFQKSQEMKLLSDAWHSTSAAVRSEPGGAFAPRRKRTLYGGRKGVGFITAIPFHPAKT